LTTVRNTRNGSHGAYEDKYNHRWYQQDFSSLKVRGADFVMLHRFIEAVRIRGPLPLDVYDSAVMSAIVELSEKSVRENRPVPFPDFTGGRWKTNELILQFDQ
jgi:hypothetical protein